MAIPRERHADIGGEQSPARFLFFISGREVGKRRATPGRHTRGKRVSSTQQSRDSIQRHGILDHPLSRVTTLPGAGGSAVFTSQPAASAQFVPQGCL